jgi:hypothetical protein
LHARPKIEGRLEVDCHVAKERRGLELGDRSLGNGILLLDRHPHIQPPIGPKLDAVDRPHREAGEPHFLTLLEVRAPAEPRVQRIGVGQQPAPRQPECPKNADDECDGHEHTDQHFVASLHDWRY